MLLALVLDVLFIGGSVYLILNEQVAAGVVMMLMGMVATGIVLVRAISIKDTRGERRAGVPLFQRGNRLRPAEVMLEPAEEESVQTLAQTNKIAAIKRVRELTGASLRTAKEYVDRFA